MPPNAKRRHKLALEPISIDELYESSTMKGLLTFMEPLPSTKPTFPEVSPDSSQETSPEVIAESLLLSVDTGKMSPDSSPEQVPDCEDELSADVSAKALQQYRGRLFQMKKGSDALIPEEQLLYQYMWNNGTPLANTAMVRTFTGSMSHLTKEIKRGDDRSTKRVVDTLIRKLAISIARRESHNHLIPRTYYVFHWNEMQARHKSQGWTWAIKNRGIQLLSEDQARQIEQLQKRNKKVKAPLRSVALCELAPLDLFYQSSGDASDQSPGDTSVILSPDLSSQTSSPSPDTQSEVSGDSSTIHPYKTVSETHEVEPTKNDIAALVTVLEQTLGHADDDAARRIWRACRLEAPQAPVDHIVHFAALTAQRVRAMKTVTNPMGLVIRHTPRHFCGESYTRFVAEDSRRRAEEQERQRRLQNELISEARKILTDPKASKEDCAFAREILADVDGRTSTE